MTDHAIITGASRGIGLSLAKLLLERGHNLTLIARNSDRLETVGSDLRSNVKHADQKILTFAADVTNETALKNAIDEACSKLGAPELVLANAGMAKAATHETLSIDDYRNVMELNFFGALNTGLSALPHMKKARKGRIVFVASGLALIGMYGQSAYAASKFALRGAAESLQAETRAHGVKVSVCYPPNTATEMLSNELQVAPKETEALMDAGGTLQPDEVARQIIAGADAGRFDYGIGLQMKALNKLHSLIKPILFYQFNAVVRRAARAKQL